MRLITIISIYISNFLGIVLKLVISEPIFGMLFFSQERQEDGHSSEAFAYSTARYMIESDMRVARFANNLIPTGNCYI